MEIHFMFKWRYTSCSNGDTLHVQMEIHFMFKWRYTSCSNGDTLHVQMEIHFMFKWRYTSCSNGDTLYVQIVFLKIVLCYPNLVLTCQRCNLLLQTRL
jgi:hypothetical protein